MAKQRTVTLAFEPALTPPAEIELSENSRQVLRKRYLRKGLDGKPIEDIEGMFRRVANAVAEPDAAYGYDIQIHRRFVLCAALRSSVLPELSHVHRRRHAPGPTRGLLRPAHLRRSRQGIRRHLPDPAATPR